MDLSNPSVHIINSAAEWENIRAQFLDSRENIDAIGVDCEWVEGEQFERKDNRDRTVLKFNDHTNSVRKKNGALGKVSLLQLATHQGMTLLIRLCLFDSVPKSLQEMLESTTIMKIGVNIVADVKKLYLDWEIKMQSFIDLRNVVSRSFAFMDEYVQRGIGLKKLGSYLAGVDITEEEEEHLKMIRYSHWAARELTADQIEYATNDARWAINGLMTFATTCMPEITMDKSDPAFWPALRKILSSYLSRECPKFVQDFFDHGKDADELGPGAAAASSSSIQKRPRDDDDDEWTDDESDVDYDVEKIYQSDDFRDREFELGAKNAVLFYDESGKPMAAFDSHFLEILSETNEKHTAIFDVQLEDGDIVEMEVVMEKVEKK